MNVAVLMDINDPLGGVNLWALRVAQALESDSVRARAIGLDDSSPAEPYAAKLLNGFECHRVGVSGVVTPGLVTNRLQTWPELSAEARHCVEWADVLVPNYFEFGFRLAATAIAEGKPMCVLGIVHTDEEYYYQLLTHYEPVVSHFVAVSRRCSERLSSLMPGRRVEYLPYGVPQVEPVRSHRAAGALRLIYVGRLEQYQKRVYDLAAIAWLLAAAGHPFELRIIGSGSCESGLRQKCEGLPPGAVEFLGVRTREEIAANYRWADVLLLTSEMEGLPFVLLEGMSSGCAPVVTRVSGTEDVVQHGTNGYLFDVADVVAASRLLGALAAQPDRAMSLGRCAQDLITPNYTWPQHVEAMRNAVVTAGARRSALAQDAANVLTMSVWAARV